MRKIRRYRKAIRILAAFLGVCLLAGCGSRAEGKGADPSTLSSAGTETKEEEIAHIVMTLPYLNSSRLDDVKMVEDAVNVISREKAQVEIELLPVDAVETGTTYPLWITQGKVIDLMVINYQDISRYMEQSLVQPLYDYLKEEGEGILAISEEWQPLMDSTTIAGNIYGIKIPSASRGSCGALWIGEHYLSELGITYDPGHIWTMEELDWLLALLKEAHPDQYPLGLSLKTFDFSMTTFFLDGYETLRGDIFSGVLLDDRKDDTLVDFFETDLYHDYLELMCRWYQLGYLYPEAATTSSSPEGLVKDQIVIAIPQNGGPGFYSEETFGEKALALRLTPVTYGLSSRRGTYWTVPVTSNNPTAAVRFLNLMYTDREVANLLSLGIEGIHYELDEDETVLVPEGKTIENIGYYNPLGLYGDQRIIYSSLPEETRSALQEYSRMAKPSGLEYEDFVFDTSSLSVERTQVRAVLDRYMDVLEAGCVDLDTTYPEFVEELHKAGIDTIIAEKQRQYDNWKAGRKE